MDFKMFNLNNCQITGRLTKDPEMKYTPKGTPVVSFSIANERTWKDGDEFKKETTFINCQAWSNTAEHLVKNAQKGMAIMVEGRLSCRKYVTQDNINKEVWEIIAERIYILEWKPKQENQPSEPIPTPDDPF